MSSILDDCKDQEIRNFEAGESLLKEGTKTGVLLVLIEGEAEVLKHGARIAMITEPGSVLGEVSALIGVPHTADVVATRKTSTYAIADPKGFLLEHPAFHMHVSETVATRMAQLIAYLTNVREQFQGHDHIGMVDTVLDKLIFRQPKRRVPPPPDNDGD